MLTLDRTHLSVATMESSPLTADPVLPQATLPLTTIANTGMDIDSPALGSMDGTSVRDIYASEPHQSTAQLPSVVPSSRSDEEVNTIDLHMSSSSTPATIPLTENMDEANITISLSTAAATPSTQASPSISLSSSSPVVLPGTDIQSPLQPAAVAASHPLSISPSMSAPSLVPAIIGHTSAPVPVSSDESMSTTSALSSRPAHLSPAPGTNPQPPTKKSAKMRPGVANTAR
jgi:hypothetical protein